MTQRRPKAVLFDLFETLMTETADEALPYPPPWGLPGKLLGIGDAVYAAAWRARKERRMTTELPYVDALIEICRECGVDAPIDVIHELHDARQSSRAQAFAAIPSSVLNMLDALRAAGFAIVVISNCSVEESVHFADSPLATRVDDVLWSFREGVQKPDPEIYRRACDRASVSPTTTYFVGDGSFDELQGAEAAGLQPIWASWFTATWPPHLAAARRTLVEGLGIPEANDPADLIVRITTTARRSTPPSTRS